MQKGGFLDFNIHKYIYILEDTRYNVAIHQLFFDI